MQNTFGSTVFRVFDKVIVAILVLVTLIFVALSVIRVPEKVVDAEELDRLKKIVRATQKSSTHTVSPLAQDYLSATVGSFRPDLQGYEMHRTGDPTAPYVYDKQEFTRTAVPESPRPVRLNAEHVGSEIRVVDSSVVKAVWAKDKNKDKKSVVLLTPVTPPNMTTPIATDVQLIKRGSVVAVIPVLVKPEEEQPSWIFPPEITARHDQRKVRLVLTPSRTRHAFVRQYVIYKGESANALEPFVRVTILPAVGPGGVVKMSAALVADAKQDVPLKDVPTGLELIDSDVDGGVRYWYAADASGESTRKERKPLKSDPAKRVSVPVHVPEAFKIKFFTLSPDYVMVVVAVTHTAPGGAMQNVKHTFRRGVVRGQAVGWKIAEVKMPRRREVIRDVDFSTGYQILDIVNGERRVRLRKVAGGGAAREEEEERQKLLLIDERGRIKVLWPSTHGQK